MELWWIFLNVEGIGAKFVFLILEGGFNAHPFGESILKRLLVEFPKWVDGRGGLFKTPSR